MNNDLIELGDSVNIHFDNAQYSMYDLSVLHVPCATGDSWHFRTAEGGLLYVQEYSRMELVEKQDS